VSCCEVDSATLGYLMAHAIIGDIPIAKSRKGYTRCPVRIVERSTTR
jgi:hypothetical protein